jgi:MFS family permease
LTASQPDRPVPLPILALAIFSANLGLSVIFPLIPHIADTSESGAQAVGWIFSSYAFTLVGAQIIGGILADRLDTAKVLRTAIWIYFLTILAFLFARSVPALMVCRAFEGLAVGTIIPCVMKLVAQVEPERRGRAIGFVMGLGGLGFLIGPLMGGYMAGYGLSLPFLAAAVVAGTAGIAVTLRLPAQPVPASGGTLKEALGHELGHLGRALTSPVFMGLIFPLMAVKVNFATLQAGLPLFGKSILGAGLPEVSYLFVITAVAYAAATPVAGMIADRFPIRPLMVTALISLIVALCALAFQRAYLPFAAVFAVFSLLQSLSALFGMKLMADVLGENAKGRSMGLAAAIGDMGMIVAPSVILPIYAWRPEGLFLGLAVALTLFTLLFLVLSRGVNRLAAS